MQALGSDIQKQVGSIAEIVLNPESSLGRTKGKALGLKELEHYMNDKLNKGIRKYRKVMSEYKSKYSGAVTHQTTGAYCTTTLLRQFMNK